MFLVIIFIKLVPVDCIVNVMGLLVNLQLIELSGSLVVFNMYYC